MREYFIKTDRIGFSKWNASDFDLAAQLWGDQEVTQFICTTGMFTNQDIIDRLDTEITFMNRRDCIIRPMNLGRRHQSEISLYLDHPRKNCCK
jgi:hypothetical protein